MASAIVNDDLALTDLLTATEEEKESAVVIASELDGKNIYTFCPPGTTLDKAKECYVPKGAQNARALTEGEVEGVFGAR